jgi:tRNA (cmo5U34)-methyltransferase
MNDYDWSFDGSTTENFDDHIERSVFDYSEFHESIVSLANFFIRKNTEIIDVGTSTGTLIYKMYNECINRNNNYIGIDKEDDMIQTCKDRYNTGDDLSFLKKNALDMDYSQASVVTICLTLQFMSIKNRKELVRRIYHDIDEGSVVFILEKVKTNQPDLHDAYTSLHYDKKRREGFSDEDILNKERSLRGVMKPITQSRNIEILDNIGYQVDIAKKMMNFSLMVAIK